MLQARRDIVEQHCEDTHSRIVEPLRLRQQNAQRLLGAKQKCLAGMKAVNKIDVALSCFANGIQERLPFLLRIRFHPAFAMEGIVLWRVEVCVHSPSGAELE